MKQENAQMKVIYTICLLVRGTAKGREICLGRKKRGFLVGRLNGSGGKVLPGEDVEDCAKRETWEEFKVEILKMKKFGEINFFDPGLTHQCHVFVVTKWRGEPSETEEMNPAWYAVATIPFEEMNRADIFWVTPILEGRKIKADFYYENLDDLGEVTRKNVRIVNSFE